jgi:hypothetical protein
MSSMRVVPVVRAMWGTAAPVPVAAAAAVKDDAEEGG